MTTTEKQRRATEAKFVQQVFHDVWEALKAFDYATDDLGMLPDEGETQRKAMALIDEFKETLFEREQQIYRDLQKA